MKRVLPAMAAAFGALGAAEAHHSLSGVYDSSRQTTVEAVVTEFQFINPHPFLLAEVRDRDGRVRAFRFEMDNRRELIDVGMSGTTFARGDRIRVTGSVGRTEETHMYVRRLERQTDGFWYEQVGFSPRVGRRP
ncbi:MAG: hypothetical protein FJW14_15655 [Acidimicrobiia bacterium]|nr:hypothetical protein [Acidimicrobiia bacterium]